MTTITTVGSGSSGNCYIIESAYNGDSRDRLILEAGMPFDAVQKALKFDLKDISGCCLSHEHGDHAGFVGQMAGKGIPIFATMGTLQAGGITGIVVQTRHIHKIGSFRVMPFETEHDAVEPCGYLIDCPDGNRIMFATDTYYLRFTFADVTAYLIECNYDEPLLRRNIKNGIVHPSVGERIRKSHMSLKQCISTLQANDLSKTKAVVLIHLSADNSQKEIFVSKIERATGKPTFVAQKNSNIKLI